MSYTNMQVNRKRKISVGSFRKGVRRKLKRLKSEPSKYGEDQYQYQYVQLKRTRSSRCVSKRTDEKENNGNILNVEPADRLNKHYSKCIGRKSRRGIGNKLSCQTLMKEKLVSRQNVYVRKRGLPRTAIDIPADIVIKKELNSCEILNKTPVSQIMGNKKVNNRYHMVKDFGKENCHIERKDNALLAESEQCTTLIRKDHNKQANNSEMKGKNQSEIFTDKTGTSVIVKCEVCEKICSSVGNLGRHMYTHSAEKPFSCYVCSKGFIRKKRLAEHINFAHRGLKPYSCNLCAKTFSMEHNLKAHMNYHSDTFKFACLICNKKYKYIGDIRKHMKRKHAEILEINKHVVELDGKEQNSCGTDTCQNHRTAFKEEKVYESCIFEDLPESSRCEQEHIVLEFSLESTDHSERKGDDSEHLLTQNSDLNNLNKSKDYERDTKDNPLALANHRGIKSLTDVNERVNEIDDEVNEIDDNFHEINNENYDFKQNQKESFRCEICHKCFSSPGNLKTHALTHSEKKRFVCSACGQGFTRKDRLTVHIYSVHTGYKPHICTVCEKAFTTNEHLRNHMVCHAVTRPFACTDCHKCFKAKSSLAKHVKRNHTRAQRF